MAEMAEQTTETEKQLVTVKCGVCGTEFVSKDDLKEHTKTAHGRKS